MTHAQFKDRLPIDVYSKWPKVHMVSSSSAQQTIDKFRSMFACHGLPTTLVSDNGSPFQSKIYDSEWYPPSSGISLSSGI